jgi:uncharacterized protein with FMN-binding domain
LVSHRQGARTGRREAVRADHLAGIGSTWLGRVLLEVAFGRPMQLALTTVGVVTLALAYPTSRHQVGVVPPLPAGAPPQSDVRGPGPVTVTGDGVLTRWGTVQVQVVVQNRRIMQSRGVRYPNLNRHGQAVNGVAVPILNQQAVARQSARLDAVSGATITSEGYMQSLQSAIDGAHL